MTQPLWQKADTVVDARIMRFLAGRDVELDRELLPYDIRASRAHAASLATIGILSADEAASLDRELASLAALVAAGDFVLDDRYEDGHSAIEAFLTERLGDTGKRIHTGRSRNDQVLVASRLYLKDRLASLRAACLAIAEVALARAASEQGIAMPGYTHLQRAVVSSAAMWWSGWAEAFVENATIARDALALVDTNPLGTAAGYGVNLPLARDETTAALGFARLQVSPVYAQLSRGKYEWQALAAYAQALADVRRLAWDLSLFTTAEYGFVSLPPQYTTGSSIMPNKRNPDVVELLRASYAVVAGAMAELSSLTSLPSGYQRDLQFSKEPTLRACAHAQAALDLVPALLEGLAWNEDKLAAAIEPAMYATDLALERAAAGVPFRDAYREAAEAAKTLSDRTPATSLAARTSPGGAADLRLDVLRARLDAARA